MLNWSKEVEIVMTTKIHAALDMSMFLANLRSILSHQSIREVIEMKEILYVISP